MVMDNIKLIEDINGSPENLSLLQGAFMKSGLTFCIDGNYKKSQHLFKKVNFNKIFSERN